MDNQTTAVDAVGAVGAISTDTADAAAAVLAAPVATGADVTAAAVAAAPPAPSAVPQCGLGAQMHSLAVDALDDDVEAWPSDDDDDFVEVNNRGRKGGEKNKRGPRKKTGHGDFAGSPAKAVRQA